MEIYVISGLMYNMKTQIVIFEGNKQDGIFSTNKKFYPKEYSEKDIFNSIKQNRIDLGKKHGFSGLKMFQVKQKMEDNDVYPDNKAVLIGKKHLKNEYYFTEIIIADILVISNKYKGVALSHRMADCPVLIIEDRKQGISAIVHCGIYHINRGLPKEFVKVMINKYKCKAENLYLYIGSCIKKESYIYKSYPKIATIKKIWKDAITKEEDGYHIDLIKAIKNQIEAFNLAGIKISPIDTATDKDYASHYAAVHGDKSKLGQNIVGFYYK